MGNPLAHSTETASSHEELIMVATGGRPRPFARQVAAQSDRYGWCALCYSVWRQESPTFGEKL